MRKAQELAQTVAELIYKVADVDLLAAAASPGDLMRHRPAHSSLSRNRYSESESVGCAAGVAGPSAPESDSEPSKDTSREDNLESRSVERIDLEGPDIDGDEEPQYCSLLELQKLVNKLGIKEEDPYVAMSHIVTTDTEVVITGPLRPRRPQSWHLEILTPRRRRKK